MNKAFMREPDQAISRCPSCHSIGQPVGPQTLNAQLSPLVRKILSESGYFCSECQCPVVYFDDFSGVVTRSDCSSPISVKDADAPICSCFGLMREAIEEDLAEGTVTRTKAAVLRAQSDEARCSTLAPNGRSCIPEIQGYFFKCKQRQAGQGT